MWPSNFQNAPNLLSVNFRRQLSTGLSIMYNTHDSNQGLYWQRQNNFFPSTWRRQLSIASPRSPNEASKLPLNIKPTYYALKFSAIERRIWLKMDLGVEEDDVYRKTYDISDKVTIFSSNMLSKVKWRTKELIFLVKFWKSFLNS